MSSIKCPTCGLTNFATAEACKRCKQTLEAPAYPYWQGANAVAPPKPDWSKLQTVPAVPLDPATLAGYGDGCHTVGNILFAIYLGLHLIGMLCALLVMGAAFPEEVWRVVTNPKNTLYLASFEPMYYLGLLGLIIFLPASSTVPATVAEIESFSDVGRDLSARRLCLYSGADSSYSHSVRRAKSETHSPIRSGGGFDWFLYSCERN
jgi:hypothetical protein